MAAIVQDTLLRLRRLIQSGSTWRTASTTCNVPLSSAFKSVTRKWPRMRRRRHAPRLTAVERDSIRAAIDEGRWSYRDLARRFNRSPDTIRRLAMLAIAEFCADLDYVPPDRCRRHRCSICGALIETTRCLACELRRAS